MNKSNQFLGFQYFLFSPQDRQQLRDNHSAYELWSDVWGKTFNELKNQVKIYSDDFLRHEEVGTICFRGRPIGMVLHTFYDLSLSAHKNHSYFSTYPNEVIDSLIQNGHTDIMVMSYLTVDEKWRRTASGLRISDVLIGLTVNQFKRSKRSALISYTRNNRKVNDLVYRFGAEPLLQKHIEHNVEVDIISIYKDRWKLSPYAEVRSMVDYLWLQKGDKRLWSQSSKNLNLNYPLSKSVS